MTPGARLRVEVKSETEQAATKVESDRVETATWIGFAGGVRS